MATSQSTPRMLFTCPSCGQLFEQLKSEYLYRQKHNKIGLVYCSSTCRGQYSRKIVEQDHPKIIEQYLRDRPAASIAADYDVSPTTILKILKKYNIFIRQSTDYIAMGVYSHPTKGKGHSEEAREKIRAANQRHFASEEARQQAAHKQCQAMAQGKIKTVSGIERLVATELDMLGVAYQQQFLIRNPRTGQYGACVDFYLDSGVVIEVNGTYWHADPRFYPNGPIYQSQKHTAKKYVRKMELLSTLGIPVVELWEADIKENCLEAVRMGLENIQPVA